jgi:hypothetical protein
MPKVRQRRGKALPHSGSACGDGALQSSRRALATDWRDGYFWVPAVDAFVLGMWFLESSPPLEYFRSLHSPAPKAAVLSACLTHSLRL